MGKKPNNLVVTFLANKVAGFLGENPDADVEEAIVDVVEANPKYQKYDWGKVEDALKDKIAGMVEEQQTQKVSLSGAKAPPKVASDDVEYVDSAPEKIRLKGKANLTVNPDGTVDVEGGKKIGIKCGDDKKPFLEEKAVKGRTIKRAGCRTKKI